MLADSCKASFTISVFPSCTATGIAVHFSKGLQPRALPQCYYYRCSIPLWFKILKEALSMRPLPLSHFTFLIIVIELSTNEPRLISPIPVIRIRYMLSSIVLYKSLNELSEMRQDEYMNLMFSAPYSVMEGKQLTVEFCRSSSRAFVVFREA